MIGSIIYGETCQGTLNYVFGKESMRILGYGNMYSQEISQKFFGNVLHFQGQRNATKNRYAHISLNLPHDEHLDDDIFLKVSKEYMHGMGYGEQPYVVVRHNDTKHEHVHIVTTNVTEEGKVLGIYNSYRTNMATTRYLEKKYGLSQSPSTKQERELPVYRLPEQHFGIDPTQGTRFYIQDVLNSILQRYKVRSFGELARLVKPYHIEIKRTKSRSGRIGAAFGLNNQKGYRTRFVNGSQVHRSLSGPKLQKVFDIHSKSKLLPMHRKRLVKQIETTYSLFKTIRPHDLAEVLEEYGNIEIRLDRKGDSIMGYSIYDKSGYVFTERELSPKIRMQNRLDIFRNGEKATEIDTESNQFRLEVQKLLKEAIRTSYLKSPKQEGLLSEHIMTSNLGGLVNDLTESKNYRFLDRYLPEDKKVLFREAVIKEYPMVRERLFQLETKKEKETLESKFRLIGDVLEKGIFNVGTEKGSVRLLFQSLGVSYDDNKLYFANSKRHTVPVALANMPFPKAMEKYVSSGFVRQNHLVLEMLSKHSSDNSPKLTASTIFLPMVFPKLFERMNPIYKERYESVALGSYLEHAERMHAPFEKSPKDYIAFFNAKGFYFVKGKKGLEVKSIYTDNGSGYILPKRTSLYLSSIPNLAETLKKQHVVTDGLIKDRRDNLKNLWAGHLMERGLYDRVAFMLTSENVYPNLHGDVIDYHMGKGLWKTVQEAMARKSGIQKNRLLRKGVYAISSLLGDRGKKQDEVFNGFKDELTDWSKYKSKGISF